MKTLFIAWQDHSNTRGWFPVGRLDVNVEAESYRFRYLKGAEEASECLGFQAFDSFPELSGDYHSSELFPFFANRLQNSNQPGFQDFLHRLALDNGDTLVDPLEILAISEGRRATDNIEIFPRVCPAFDGSFAIKFFLHGWRYGQPHQIACVHSMQTGDALGLAIEVTNPVTGRAVQLLKDHHVVGYAPRYLVDDLVSVIARCSFLEATVSRVNLPPAPPSQRILVNFSGCWPEGFEPMNGPQFQLLSEECELAGGATFRM